MSGRPEAPPSLLALALGVVVAGLLRLLGATWRLREEGEDPLGSGAAALGAMWHRGLFCAAWRFRDRGVVIPVSRSRDGERIVAVLGRLGYGPSPRGSSSNGARAVLTGLIRAARAGHAVGVLCDGPRGPARACKPGVIAVARATGLPIHPLGFAARPALAFGSWDRALLPVPFARVQVVAGPVLIVPREAGREELEAARVRLEAELDRLQARAEALLGPRET
jgi:lysophospholipid acyltransferase (LPLAT)-like uncharacterized protein